MILFVKLSSILTYYSDSDDLVFNFQDYNFNAFPFLSSKIQQFVHYLLLSQTELGKW